MPARVAHKYLDFGLVEELPDSYAWKALDHDLPSEEAHKPNSVPIIDLDHNNAIELIGSACKTWGVFQVVNHNISKNLLDDIEYEGRKLFSLPMHQKLKAARSPDGPSGYGVPSISSFFPKLMWHEGFTISGSPLAHARQLWPEDHTRFCQTIQEYEKEMNKLAERIMWLILGSLNINKEDITWAGSKDDQFQEGSSAVLQLNSYPACPDPDRAMGLAAHTDSTIVTILHQTNNTSGLQVYREDYGWTRVPPQNGALVVNVGDLLHILTNGWCPSVLHRAVVHRTQHRLSIAYLYGPPSSARISPIPKLVDKFHPQLYRAITWGEYLGIKAKHFDKALRSVLVSDPTSESLGPNDDNC
uniref:gibberellin 3beta-dioxygenase n=1 Tax=Jasminum sambac TaxID=660624 RepID=A0A977R5A3_9LAMI|nr:2-oxoglutarate-dependent dioxygenase GA 3-oxidase [Jasminum sambac]